MEIYKPGTVIDDQYEVVSRPMMGGMGIVYFCLDNKNEGHPVALKTFKPEFLTEFTVRDQFLREASVWVDLNEFPHIVRCHRVMSSGINTFLVLELVSAEIGYADASLRSRLHPNKPLALSQSLSFAIQIPRGLQYASTTLSGFVHRDLKPENILVGADSLPNWSFNRLRVTDFGLSAFDEKLAIASKDLRKPQDLNNIGSDRVAGTPLYMAPEQWMGQKLGTYTDVYALGCILAEMLSGMPVASEKTIAKLRTQHCSGNLRSLPDDLPINLVEFISKCLSLHPEKRFQNWENALEDLCAVFYEVTGQNVPDLPTQKMLDSEEGLNNANSYNSIGLSYSAIGKYEKAREYHERALNIGYLHGDEKLQISGLINLGTDYERLGKHQIAIEYLEKALEVAKRNAKDGELLEIIILGNMGIIYNDLGQHEHAIKLHEQQLEYARANGDFVLQSYALGNLGLAHDSLGQFQQAIECYTQSIELKRERGNRYGEANSLGNLGVVYSKLGQFKHAIELHEQQLEITHAIGDEHGKSSALSSLGSCYEKLGDFEKAIMFLDQCLDVQRMIGDLKGETATLRELGGVYHRLGQYPRAIEYHEQQLHLALAISDKQSEAFALGNLGNASFMLSQYPKAKEYYEQAISITRLTNDQRTEASLLEGLGGGYLKTGQYKQAIEYFEHSFKIWQGINDSEGQIGASFNLALAYAANGENDRAIVLAQQIEAFYASRGMTEKLQDVRKLLSVLQGDDSANSSEEELSRQVLNKAVKAFQNAKTLEEMRTAIKKYPIIVSDEFVHDIKRFIAEAATAERKPIFEQKLDWLNQIEVEREQLLNTALKAFIYVDSYEELREVVKHYPIVVTAGFLQSIESIISDEDSTEHKSFLEQRFEWLKQIAEKEN